MNTFQQRLEQYAALAAEVGVNVQSGQLLCIMAPTSASPFVREVAKHAYRLGAKYVHVDWSDEGVTRARAELSAEEGLSFHPSWHGKARVEMAEEGAAFLWVVADDPDLLAGIDPKRIALSAKAQREVLRPFQRYTLNNSVAWSIVAVPSVGWANKVFPDLPETKQVDALWDAIFAAVRVDAPNPIATWSEHALTLNDKAQWLNGQQFQALRYQAPGTDLTIGLPDNHVWSSAGKNSAQGHPFMPNMPTEEVFASPHRDRVNGTVASSKPLSYNGNLIDDFSLTFKDGRIVEYSAGKQYETLKQLIETDDGSHYLGELALVPHHSPISNTNLIFYNTLFDENASCHLAIGFGFPFALKGGLEMSKEQLVANGINDSLTHVDFMIGSAELNIDGIKPDGSSVPIFRKGNWAF